MRKTALLAGLLVTLPVLRADSVLIPVVTPGTVTSPIQFEADRTVVLDVSGGKLVRGDLFLVTPLGKIKLAGSDVMFNYAPGTSTVTSMHGEAYVPSPLDTAYVTIRRPAMAEVGIDQGKNLSLGIPLNSDRYYVYFRFNAGFGMDIGTGGGADDTKAFSLDIPVGANATLILDPLDPFYYYSGAIITPKKNVEDSNRKPKPDGKVEDNFAKLGKGTSRQGIIPFHPATTYGVADHVKDFSGERIILGTFQFPELPILAIGYKIEDVQPGAGESGQGLFGVEIVPFQQVGVNADVFLSYNFLKLAKLGKIANFTFALGNASGVYQSTNDVLQAYVSGILKPDTSWIPDFIPIVPQADGHAYGYLSSKLSDFRLHIDTEMRLDTANFGRLSGIEMGDLLRVKGLTSISQDGYRLAGSVYGGLGPLGEAERTMDVWMPFQEDDGYIESTGRFRVVTLSVSGRGRVSKDGILVSGRWADSNEAVEVTGLLSSGSQGPFVQGTMSVPPSWQPDFQGEIQRLAASSRKTVSDTLTELQAATKNYEFELSLRGMRTIIPTICDTILANINSEINAQVPSPARSYASDKADPYRTRIRTLKSAVQAGDNATTRAALKAAIQNVLNNQRLRITQDLLVTTIVLFDEDFISADTESKLRTAMSAVDALPAASSRKVSAESAWSLVPKEEVLQTVDQSIQSAASAIPRIVAIGFNQPLSASSLKLFVDVAVGSKTGRVSLDFDPANPAAAPKAIAQLVRQGLNANTFPAPVASETTSKVPVLTQGGVVSGASIQKTIAPGAWVTLYGINLSTTTRSWRADEIRNGVLPTSLDGVRVTIDGQAAAVAYISPTQINALAPAGLRLGNVQVQVQGNAGTSATVEATVQSVAPSFFDTAGSDGTRYAVATSVAYEALGPANRPAKPGEVIILWGTGFGPIAPGGLANVPVVTIGGIEAELVGAALSPGYAGLYQIAVRIPDAVRGVPPVSVATGGATSPAGIFLHVEP